MTSISLLKAYKGEFRENRHTVVRIFEGLSEMKVPGYRLCGSFLREVRISKVQDGSKKFEDADLCFQREGLEYYLALSRDCAEFIFEDFR